MYIICTLQVVTFLYLCSYIQNMGKSQGTALHMNMVDVKMLKSVILIMLLHLFQTGFATICLTLFTVNFSSKQSAAP